MLANPREDHSMLLLFFFFRINKNVPLDTKTWSATILGKAMRPKVFGKIEREALINSRKQTNKRPGLFER